MCWGRLEQNFGQKQDWISLVWCVRIYIIYVYIISLLSGIVEHGDRSIMMKIIGWVCGISDAQAPEPTEEEVAEASKQLPDISEDPLWKYIVNTNALIMMTVAVYCWGYYA